MFCWCLCQLISILLGLFVIYKLIDRIIRIPYVGDYGNRYVLVTGANSGLGLDLVKRLDSLGCHVFAGSRSEQGETVLRKVCSSRVHPISLDVTKPDSVRKAFQIVTDRLATDGNKDLWGVVNNAGGISAFGPLEWLRIDDYRAACDVNLYGCIDVTMTFLPLVKRSRGRVVNVTSMAGSVPWPYVTTHGISKGGQDIFSATLRGWLNQYGCKVCIVSPGYHRTNITAVEANDQAISNCWNQTTPETKAEFGEDFYQNLRNELLRLLDTMPTIEMSATTDANIHALFGRYPRARYEVQWSLALLPILQWYLPVWIFDKMTAKMELSNTLPPAALRNK